MTDFSDNVDDVIREVLYAEPSVRLAYLFGSMARGTAGPLSDIDIGVVFSDGDTALGRLEDRLVERLQTDRVDLVSLAVAPVPLRFRVVRDGRLLLSRDEVLRERFEVDAIRRYLDFKPLRDGAFALVRDAILRES